MSEYLCIAATIGLLTPSMLLKEEEEAAHSSHSLSKMNHDNTENINNNKEIQDLGHSIRNTSRNQSRRRNDCANNPRR